MLFGPPGIRKSSLIAAMANYLNFDIYDLQFRNLIGNSQLRQLLISTANRSILVVEDIDCSLELQDRRTQQPRMMNLDLDRTMIIDPYPTTQVHFFFPVFNRSIMPHHIVETLKKYDWGALSFDIKLCKTNHSSKSAMRAPQATFIAEAVIEHVAATLSLDVDSVRSKNLHNFNSLVFFFEGSKGEPVEYTLPSIWNKLAISSSFKERTEKIKQFNTCNK